MTRIAVVALGGNAIAAEGQAATFEQQNANATRMAHVVRELISGGYRVVLTHGNGPQVGNLALQQEETAASVPPQPLFVLDAMTQGQVGHMLALALRNLEPARPPPAVAVVTHVLVDSADPVFAHPDKPIGPFFTRAHAAAMSEQRGWRVTEDAGRGYRKVVPSPRPLAILEEDSIRILVEAGFIVIAVGGGGVPVCWSGAELVGAEAVIDKDLGAQVLASAIGADDLIMITGVGEVLLDYGTASARPILEISSVEAEAYLEEGQFAAGSMAPKIAAAVRFLESGGHLVVITSPEHILEALRGAHGTRIVRSPAA